MPFTYERAKQLKDGIEGALDAFSTAFVPGMSRKDFTDAVKAYRGNIATALGIGGGNPDTPEFYEDLLASQGFYQDLDRLVVEKSTYAQKFAKILAAHNKLDDVIVDGYLARVPPEPEKLSPEIRESLEAELEKQRNRTIHRVRLGEE